MKLRELTVGELPEFIESTEYQQLNIKPISPLRAKSQFKNPYATPNDPALVYAYNKNTLLGFVGLLPDLANNHIKSKLFSNTGWWVNKKHGQNIGLVLFLRALQYCHKKMFFTDCSEHTKSILEKTGLFTFSKPIYGKRYFFRFYFRDLIRKKTKIKAIIWLAQTFDFFLNFIVKLFKNKKSSLETSEYSVTSIQTLDNELNEFIISHSEKAVLQTSAEKLNWIIQNPWMSTFKETPKLNYPFSYITDSFSQEFLLIEKQGRTIAILFLSIRDGHAHIPYSFFDKELTKEITPLILQQVWAREVKSLLIYKPELINFMQKFKKSIIYKKDVVRFTGYSNEIDKIVRYKEFHDGDGDIAFT